MSQSEPPSFATLILERFVVSDYGDALIGDLVEQYRAGRSTGWYWRQVLLAVLVGASKTIFHHKLLTVRAIAVWWVTDYLYYLICWTTLWHRPSFSMYLSRHHLWSWAAILNVLLVSILTGWVVGRCHRRHRVAMVLICAIASNLRLSYFLLPLLWMQLVDSIDQPRFRPYLAANLALFIAITVGFILGGVLMWPKRKQALQPDGG